MEELKSTDGYRKFLATKLSDFFLYTVFTKPELIRGKVAKHLELPDTSVSLGKSIVSENEITIPLILTPTDCKQEFALTFKRRIDEPKEIEIPKVVKKEKKWWQFGEPESEVIVEKKTVKQTTYWILNSIK